MPERGEWVSKTSLGREVVVRGRLAHPRSKEINGSTDDKAIQETDRQTQKRQEASATRKRSPSTKPASKQEQAR
jgi:hypothetical protein